MVPQAQPLVSVVTPVYNGDRYLAECIESVLAQTYQHWEYDIVNNCSTDRSLEIAQYYAEKDARIRVHNNVQFLGALQNCNHAFRQCAPESKYCKALHADDWLFPDCIMQMVKVAEANPSVGIVGSYVLAGVRLKCDGLPYPSTVIPGREVCRWHLLGKGYVFGSPTSLLIRSDLIRSRERFYNESNIHAADQEACHDVLQHADFGFVHQVLTFTRVHDESRSSRQQQLNAFILGKLMVVTKYGPMYLTSEEYEQCLAKWMQRYYQFLGSSALQRKGKEFWEYHETGLKNLGLPLSRARLTKAAIRELYARFADGLFHPRTTVHRITMSFKNNGKAAR